MARPSDARERLIRAAVKLFRRHGYDGVGLTEILTEADAPKGSFYHHFPDGKEQLAAAAVDAAGAFVRQLAETEFAKATCLQDGVRRVANVIADGFERSTYSDGCPIIGIALGTVPQSAVISAAVKSAFLDWQKLIVAHARRLGEPKFGMDDALALVVLIEGAWIVSRMQSDAAALRNVGRMFDAQRRAKAPAE